MGNTKRNKLEKEQVLEVFGQPRDQKNGEWIYRCPLCEEMGADKNHDHLKINIAKGHITCFADEEHSKELRKKYFAQTPAKERHSTVSILVNEEQAGGMNESLLAKDQMLDVIKGKGYTTESIKRFKIGEYMEDYYTIPMYSIEGELVGFEYRTSEDFKFNHKSKGYADDKKKTLCLVHDSGKKDNLLVMAGFKDTHTMWQYLSEKNQLENYTIVTASNGEPNTLSALKAQYNYVKSFKKTILCLDKDATGKASTQKTVVGLGLPVYELSLPYIENEANKPFKDFTDWYLLAKEAKYEGEILPKKVKLTPESLLNKYIKYDDDFDKPKFFKQQDETEKQHELCALTPGNYPTKWGYYKIAYKNKSIALQRQTNFTFEITRKVISSNNKFDVKNTHKLEIYTIQDGKPTKPVIFAPDALTRPDNIMDALNANGTHFSCLSSDDLKAILYKEYRGCDRVLHVYENPGIAKIKDKSYWLYQNACVEIETNNIIHTQNDAMIQNGVIKLDDGDEIALVSTKGMRAPNLPDVTHLKASLEKGKYSYLNETNYLSGGSDTSLNLLHNMEYYNYTPVLFSEIEANFRKRFPENIKSIYDRIPRKKMGSYGNAQDIKAINGTVHFATNDMLIKNKQTMTRLIFTEFKKNNFDCEKAKPFNDVRDDLVGMILPSILIYLNAPEYIERCIDDNVKIIEEFVKKASEQIKDKKSNIDPRSINNLAVAKTGIDLLFKVASLDFTHEQFKQLQANYNSYIAQYANISETKDHFLTFLEIFTELVKQDKAILDKDYKVINDGIAVYVKGLMPAFKEMLKRTSELSEYIPTENEIKNAAENHECEKDKVVNFSGNSKRTLFIPHNIETVDHIMLLITEKLQRKNEDDLHNAYNDEVLRKHL